MTAEFLIAFCTFPSQEVAMNVTKELVKGGLVACGNILPKVHSIYRWEGKLESNDEVLAMFKLAGHCYSEFEDRLRNMHPYEVPEIIAMPVTHALPAYLEWVKESCGEL
ncbi:MAG TPA: divalent-cation tolerance protein CutA [Chthoniobacterales bacterium]|nr:divalent-cation tolerance protein CutA [Chthoniobacterales bacterium]